MSEKAMYIEAAKECPKCHKMTLFFCTVIEMMEEHRFVGHLGVRCHSCGYEAIIKPAVHHILMTEEELEKYGKRLLAYYDKGYHVDYLYHM